MENYTDTAYTLFEEGYDAFKDDALDILNGLMAEKVRDVSELLAA